MTPLFKKKPVETNEHSNEQFEITKDPILVPENTYIEGILSADRSIRIEGVFHGVLYTKEKLIIDDSAQFFGTILAQEVLISGKVKGDIYCLGKVHVRNNGGVEGSIYTKRFENDEGTDIISEVHLLGNIIHKEVTDLNNTINANTKVSENDSFKNIINILTNKSKSIIKTNPSKTESNS